MKTYTQRLAQLNTEIKDLESILKAKKNSKKILEELIEAESITFNKTVKRIRVDAPNLKEHVRKLVNEKGRDWFTVKSIVKLIVESGEHEDRRKNSIRSSVSSYLGEHFEDLNLIRENIGSEKLPKYRYKKEKPKQVNLTEDF